MINTYKALNIPEQGEIDKARVEFNRVGERQRMAAEVFAEQIAKEKEREAKEAEERAKAQVAEGAPLKERINAMIAANFNKAVDQAKSSLTDKRNAGKISEHTASFSADTWGAQDAFTNPFATYMEGLFLLTYGEDRSDTEQAAKFFEKACRKELNPANNPPAEAHAPAEGICEGKKGMADLVDKVWAVFENGLSPEKEEMKIPLIVPFTAAQGGIIESSIVLPKLNVRNAAYPYLSLCANGKEVGQTKVICNMDAVIASEFRERMPGIITRNLIQTVVKDILQVIIIKLLEDQNVPSILSSPILSAIFGATKHADTRSWTSLPKNFQIGIVDRPQSGKLQICAPGSASPIAVAELPEGTPSVVFVKVTAPGLPPVCSVASNKAGFENAVKSIAASPVITKTVTKADASVTGAAVKPGAVEETAAASITEAIYTVYSKEQVVQFEQFHNIVKRFKCEKYNDIDVCKAATTELNDAEQKVFVDIIEAALRGKNRKEVSEIIKTRLDQRK